MRNRKQPRQQHITLKIILLFIMTLSLSIPGVFADGDALETPSPVIEEPTEEPTKAPMVEEPTEAPVVEEPTEAPVVEEPTEAPTEAPVVEEPNEEPTEAPVVEEPTQEPTEAPVAEEPTQEPVIQEAPRLIQPLAFQTFCRMEIDDRGDNNPFTYTFRAIEAYNIATVNWNLDDGTTSSGNAVVGNTHSINHTYAGNGTYTITLECQPQPGFGSLMTLTGQISVMSSPVANFMLSPAGPTYTGLVPLQISAVNTSTGYIANTNWAVYDTGTCTAGGVAALTPLATGTTTNFNYTASDYTTYCFRLLVDDGAGTSSIRFAPIAVNAPAPNATFTLTPPDGIAPLTVTVAGVDLGAGPITSWSWSWGDGSPVEAFSTAGGDTFSASLTHQYTLTGIYNLMLTYAGPGGSGGTVTRQVGVYPPGDPVVSAFTWADMGAGPGGGTLICFTNTSTGPYIHSYWNFGDGGGEVENNDAVVCHEYPSSGLRTVSLRVWNGETDVALRRESNASQFVSVGAPLQAIINASSLNITWGDTITLNGSGSTGNITSYTWDYPGINPADVNRTTINAAQLTQLGNNRIRLTVRNANGAESIDEVIVFVARLDIGCSIGSANPNAFTVLPTETGNIQYNSTVTNAAGRTITYQWSIIGGPPPTLSNATSANATLNWNGAATGSYQLTLEATASDGASCTATRTITRDYRPLDCRFSISPALPTTIYPGSTSYTFSRNILNLDGRGISSINWQVNGSAAGTGDTINQVFDTPGNYTIRYDATASDGSTCYEEQTYTVTAWPDLTCTSITGNSPIEALNPNNGSANTFTYRANVTDPAGRTLTYTWTVDQGTITSTNPRTGDNRATIRWNASQLGTRTIGVTVSAPGSQGGQSCMLDRTVTAQVNQLLCNAPTGDIDPVSGELEEYLRALSNTYGRSVASTTWEMEFLNGATWESVTLPNPNQHPLQYTFLTAGRQYRVRYTATVNAGNGLPSESCSNVGGFSSWRGITVLDAEQNFACDAFPGAPTNNLTPNNAGVNYIYHFDIDNGNAIPLQYTWTLVRPGATERVIDTFTSDDDGEIEASNPIPGVSMGPVGNYILRVNVRAVNNSDPLAPGYSTHTCELTRPITVGEINAQYTYQYEGGGAVNLNAIEVGRRICFTNTSTVSHTPVDYTWNISGAAGDNSLGATSFATQSLPNCFSFDNPGNYNVTLGISNDSVGGGSDASFRMSSSFGGALTFRVYASQSIAIDRELKYFAPDNIRFDAYGTNITPGTYNWVFTNLGTSASFNASGQSVNPFFGVPGTYRATVTGTGPLGNTSTSVDFTLIDVSGLAASFTPSTYGGIAPMRVCFTDTSQPSATINYWRWDFGNGETLEYGSSIGVPVPSEICTTYTESGQGYSVNLLVRNPSNPTGETAVNPVRTYTLMESRASFSVQPQGGARYCFQSLLEGGTALDGWEFGDGMTAGAVDPICHTYGSSGTYLVYMRILGPDGTPGMIVRSVTVDLTSSGPAPALTLSGSCSAVRTASFRVANETATAMTTPDVVTITDAAGNALVIDSVQLAAGVNRDYMLTDMAGQMTIRTIDGGQTFTVTCDSRPQIQVTAMCSGGLPAFTVRNDDGPMAAPQSFEIRDEAGNLLLSDNFMLARGAAPLTYAVAAGSDQRQTYTFTSSGLAGSFGVGQNCYEAPQVNVTATCSGAQSVFTVRNTGPAMLIAQDFEIRGAGGALVLDDSFQLARDAAMSYTTPADRDPNETFTFNSDGIAGPLRIMNSCVVTEASETITDPNAPDAVVASGGAGPTITPFMLAFNGLSPNMLSLPAWDTVPTCGHRCPPFRLYHTDETGDWEIFRLDGADAETRTHYRRNLSLSEEGQDYSDYAPSLSPNNEWIVFSSNRDGNWEIYIASTSGDPASVTRVTYNTVAIDTDPVWGPNNYVVFETTRHGSWDLYMIDMTTGREFRLTDDGADNINPFWSPDGSKLVFQSNRTEPGESRHWRLYELDLRTMTVTRLSQGDSIDVDPQYSFDGSRIVYRTYTEVNSQSIIAIMDADGRNSRAITTPDENATNALWSPSDRFIAYQSDLDGDLDIYVYEVATGQRRHLTDNTIADYAPTWLCGDERLVFTSDIEGVPNIFEIDVLPISDPPVRVEEAADQMTFGSARDIYPQNTPAEENASREGQTHLGPFGQQTSFLLPETDLTPVDPTLEGVIRQDWPALNVCPVPR